MLNVLNHCSRQISRKFSRRDYLLPPTAIEKSQTLPTVPHKNINSESKCQAVTSFSPTVLLPTLKNKRCKALTAIAPQQENPYESIEKHSETVTSSE